MIDLSAAAPVASGGGRDVYRHPGDTETLIKIFREARRSTAKKVTDVVRYEKLRYGRYREWYVEYEEYIALLARTGRVPDFIAEYRGFTQTSLGPGQLVESIRDEGTGDLSLSVAAAAGAGVPIEMLEARLREFFAASKAACAVYRDLNTSNLLAVRDRHGAVTRVVCIDGLGDFTLIPVRKWSRRAYEIWHARASQRCLFQVRSLAVNTS